MTTIASYFVFGNQTGLRHLSRFAVVAVLIALSVACAPQDNQVFSARLSPFPVIGGNAGGMGQATATLNGTTLEISGSFEGLTYREGRGGDLVDASAAGAELRQSPVTAVGGEAFTDLTLEPGDTADTGTISGSVELTADQVDMLRNGRIYAQIDSEEAPGGHLWGWFLQ